MHMKVGPRSFVVYVRNVLTREPAVVHAGKLDTTPTPSLLIIFSQLFYKSGRLRVVVSTANLIEIDWRDIENVSDASYSVRLFG